ncbi:MAG: histidine ammonia-lyase [Desulfobacterales bacterium]|jgi:histidine ammonia-lyase|nr:histidine ammonia-lyase [Desulfobacterales bacterium]
MKALCLNDEKLTLENLTAVARQGLPVRLGKKAEQRIIRSRALIDRWVLEEKRVYGITTGFGALSDVAISSADARELQKNILLSHAAGVGDPLPEEVVRAAMLLRIKDFSLGYTGVRPETVAHLLTLLNSGVCPVVPSQGSVGASGDLAPLAHMALVLIGEGEAVFEGRRMSGKKALKQCGLTPLVLAPGEGLALVNGTQVMTATGALAVRDAALLAKMADITAAMSLEVLMGSRTEFDPRIHRLRPHNGQIESADNMLRITKNSEIISSHKDCTRVQDAYTLRCSPQVHGASRDVLAYAKRTLETEINSATGNPLIFSDTGEFLVGGNFHGQPVAMAMDALGMAVAEWANISERRIERLVNPQLSGLPAFLISDGGLHSGMMIAQYTAAALVSENKVLAHPACVDSIPTSANKEDHVSMGAFSAGKCRRMVQNAQTVIAIELLCGAQAMDLFTNLKPGEGTLAAYKAVRAEVTHLTKDRILAKDIDNIGALMRSGRLVAAVENAVGVLY